ncbi:hypothetical protein IWW48_003254 [Coemansia sp. RSA 1200]|nr:hypothetical protein IWW48_003254 [Coemansia sp. RSA 1200]
MTDQNQSSPDASLSDTNTLLAGEKPRIKMQLYKTEPCQNWTLYGVCRYGNLCKFAHGMTEQRSRLRHPMYKTSLCKDFPLGKCTFGNRCNFAHSLDELRTNGDGQMGITGNLQMGLEASPQGSPSQQQQQSKDSQQTSPTEQSQPQSPSLPPQQQQQQQQQQLPQAKKFQKRHKQQQLQALLQTPVTMLPDGRLISTFTPVTATMGGGSGSPSAGAAPMSPSSLSRAKGGSSVASVRAFGELRKYQSMGTLRTTNQLMPSIAGLAASGSPAAQQQQQQKQRHQQHPSAQSLFGQQPQQASADSHPSSVLHSPTAAAHHPSIAAGVVSSSMHLAHQQQSFGAKENIKQHQQLPSMHQHFQQGQEQEHANVARRVASLSQLPSLRSGSAQTGPQPMSLAMAAAAAANGGGGTDGSYGLDGGSNGSGNLLLQNSFQLSSLGAPGGSFGNGHYYNHHRRESSFALTPRDMQSPSHSSLSFRENDEDSTPPPPLHQHQQPVIQGDYSSILNEGDFARLSVSSNKPLSQIQHQQYQNQQQYLHNNHHHHHHPHAAQRRMLTSSVSMQTLPRFKVPINWEQQPQQQQQQQHQSQTSSSSSVSSSALGAGATATTAAGPAAGSSSQSSAATLIDSDVWSNTPPPSTQPAQQLQPPSLFSGNLSTSYLDQVAQNTSKQQQQQQQQLYESRFFPSAAASATATGESPAFGAFSLVATGGVDPLGIYYPSNLGNHGSPHGAARHQQLRRQQSTDDWMLLRQSRGGGASYGPPGVIAADGGGAMMAPNAGSGSALDSHRLSSLEHLRVAAAQRRQINTPLKDSSVYLF